MHDNKRTGYDKTVRNPRPRTLKRKNPSYSSGGNGGRTGEGVNIMALLPLMQLAYVL